MEYRQPNKMHTNGEIHKMEYIFQVSDLQDSSQNISFLLIILGIGVALRIICNALKLRYCYYPLMLLMGFFAGFAIHYMQHRDYYNFSFLAEINPNIYLLIFLPVMLFHTAFSMDYHGFGHSTPQVLIISIIAYPVQLTLMTIMFVYLHEAWNWEVAITFAIVCSVIESEYVLQELNKTHERVKHIQLLLQGEQLAILATATFSFRVNFEHYYGTTDTAPFFFLTMLWHILSVFTGLILGYFLGYLFVITSSEIPVAVALTMVGAFFSFYVGHIFLSQAGVITTIVTGVMLSPTKLKTTLEVETQISYYWDWFSYIFKTIAFVIPGVIVGLNPDFISLRNTVYVFVVYFFCFLTRFGTYFLSWPLLQKVGHQLTWKNIAVITLGPYRAAPTLIIAMLYRQYSPKDGQEVLTFIAMLCLLSQVFSGFAFPLLLQKLGMHDLTHARAINLRNALASVQECRNKAIISLKMDRVLADANWTIVEETTRLCNPELKINEIGDAMKMPDVFEVRKATCRNCDEESPILPTKKELKDLEKEAKLRILKVQQVSLARQYESGTLSKNSMRALSMMLQNSMEKEDPRLDVNEFKVYWSTPKYVLKMKLMLEFILKSLPKKYEFVLLPKVRPTLFRIINTLTYRMLLTFLTLLDTYFILNYALDSFWPPVASIPARILQSFDFFFYIVFMGEFVVLIFALGHVQYFKRQYHKIDFTCNVLIRTTIIVMVIEVFIEEQTYDIIDKKDKLVLDLSKMMLLLRLNRLYTVTEVVVLNLLHVVQDRLDNTLVQYYDTGKAFIVATDRTLKHLRHIVQDKAIYMKLRKLLENDRKAVAKSIGIIQKEQPNIAASIKTRHAIKQVINEMNDCINEIYDDGLLDDIEKKYLKGSLDGAKKRLRSLKVIAPCSPENILKEVPWLFDEKETALFLLKHARLVNYSYHDRILDAGDDPEDIGLIILVSGLVKCVYRPNAMTIQNCKKEGALPNCDFLSSLKFEESQEDYVVSGNLIGEIGIVTNRKFDMTIICESAVQAYHIPLECVHKVLYDEMNISTSIFCKVWKCIGIRIALILLQYVFNFQGWLREKTLFYLENAFVPLLSGVEELLINELVADVVLIEGVVMDGNTRTVFYAPFYIPRTTNKIILPGTSKWNIDPEYTTRLLIVPSKNAEEIDIMGPGHGGIIRDGTEVQSGMQLRSSESSLALPLYMKTKDYKRSTSEYHEFLYARPPTKQEFQKQLTSSSTPNISFQGDDSSDTFSSDSDVPRLKIFQKNIVNAVQSKSQSRIKVVTNFHCTEDVLEHSDGEFEEDIFDYDQQRKIIANKIRKKQIMKRIHEIDSETQSDLTAKEPALKNANDWWWG